MQKRIAAIHDISCIGKCSLTAALPIISAAGIEVSVIPTAVLSTHTGGFEGFTYRDLTDDILPIVKHWTTLPIGFDAVYTGFLGSFAQLDIVAEVIGLLRKKNTLVIVDPVMADAGELYQTFPDDYPSGMRRFCASADVIVPNVSEAALLLGEPYQKGPYSSAYIEELLAGLAALGPPRVVLTGVSLEEAQIGAAVFDQETGEVAYAFSQRIPGFYHGTGDVFASVLTASVLQGFDLPKSARIAVDFTAQSVCRTHKADTDPRFGVNFEQCLPELIQMLRY